MVCDDKLPEEICDGLQSLIWDLETSLEVTLPRQALNEHNSYGLHILCDSSVESYGLLAYALSQNNKISFLFPIYKLTPLNQRSDDCVPALELMGLPIILEASNNTQFQFKIYVQVFKLSEIG